jgi:hypothetical protein
MYDEEVSSLPGFDLEVPKSTDHNQLLNPELLEHLPKVLRFSLIH